MCNSVETLKETFNEQLIDLHSVVLVETHTYLDNILILVFELHDFKIHTILDPMFLDHENYY